VVGCDALLVFPPWSVTVSFTVYVPGAAYMWVAVRVGSFVVCAGEPSPKSKRKLASAERPDCEPEASATAMSGGLAACESESLATSCCL
jgi:hypothetical protein